MQLADGDGTSSRFVTSIRHRLIPDRARSRYNRWIARWAFRACLAEVLAARLPIPRFGDREIRMPHKPSFLFATCQAGAETALKREIGRSWPAFRFAYSRPGFVTFKLPTDATPPDNLDLKSVFARASGLSLGKVTAPDLDSRVRATWELIDKLPVEAVHVWPRDAREPGYRDYEPGLTEDSRAIAARIRAARPEGDRGEAPSAPGQLVADIVLVDEAEWWVGYHRVHSTASSWVGGFFEAPLPTDAVSRVYLKMLEALRWSGFAVGKGNRVVEIGCAPGGASQALLDLGARVVGIDPAEMHPLVLGHPRFEHVRRRARDVPRRVYLESDWLTCDINLPPNYTLDTVEALLQWPGVRFQGLLLTLKLVDWSLADDLPGYLERVRSWGFRRVEARQLHHNRRELCVAAGDYAPPGGKSAEQEAVASKRTISRKTIPRAARRKAARNPAGRRKQAKPS
jgi:23S rRNA (cytidine2498-2'-O)-methyltransferase